MGELSLVAALLGGVLTLLSPCSVLLLPAFFAYTFVTPGRLVGRIAVFYLGLVVTLAPLGVAAATAGAFVNDHRAALVAGLSILIVVLGLLQAVGVSPRLLRLSSAPQGDGIGAIFVLGLVYGVAGVCSGPILGSVLAVAGLQGDPIQGGLLLAVYAAGMVLPLLVIAPWWGRLGPRRRLLAPRTVSIGRVTTNSTNLLAGAVLVTVGTIFGLTEGTVGLTGVLSIDQQFSVEVWARRAGQAVPDAVALGVAVLIVVTVVTAVRIRTAKRSKVTSSDP